MTIFPIDIKHFLGNTLDTRDEATKLFSLIRNNTIPVSEITLNFLDVQFMSRSFADQFYKERAMFLEQYNIPITILNAPIQVREILDAVSKSQNKQTQTTENFRVYSFSNEDQLVQYMCTL